MYRLTGFTAVLDVNEFNIKEGKTSALTHGVLVLWIILSNDGV